MTIVTSKTVLPGQYGTKRLLEKYGDKLLAVRYKLDTQRKKKLKTVEIVIDEWEFEDQDKNQPPPNKIMHLHIEYGEKELGLIVRNAGGFWNKEQKYWELAYGTVLQMGLEDRIIWE
ncbi:hypothetical protein KJ762_12655 [bacterium]|nr:hypothetical protein [bacterium]MBU1065944.1 hypothetical protein [bacterium]MBU1635342.1 hypothetical protein [bacterium]MBU1873794.1 hypothetical protein [bacterium]